MRFVLTWLILAAFWIGLSGYFDAIHLAWGFAAVTLVSAISHRHLLGDLTLPAGAAGFFRLLRYAPWLVWQVAKANVDVLLRVIGKKPVDPMLFRFKPDLESEFGRTTLANSITLTPGTVTVEVEEDGHFIVHAIAPEAEEGLVDGEMESRVRVVEGAS